MLENTKKILETIKENREEIEQKALELWRRAAQWGHDANYLRLIVDSEGDIYTSQTSDSSTIGVDEFEGKAEEVYRIQTFDIEDQASYNLEIQWDQLNQEDIPNYDEFLEYTKDEEVEDTYYEYHEFMKENDYKDELLENEVQFMIENPDDEREEIIQKIEYAVRNLEEQVEQAEMYEEGTI